MRVLASVSILTVVLASAAAAADPCPPPSRLMLEIARKAIRVRLVRLAGREQAKNPFARDTTFLGYRARGGADLRPRAAKLVSAAFGRSASYGCGEMPPDSSFANPLALGFDFDSPLFGRLRLVLLEPERTVQMFLDSGAYAESKLSDRGLRAWHAALGEILRQRGETRADFERRMGAPAAPASEGAPIDSATAAAAAVDSTRALDLAERKQPALLAFIKVPPAYPDEAREAGIDGTVVVSALVDPHGNVRDAKVVESIPMLDAAALAAVRQWRFQPYLDRGVAVWAWTRVPVRFSLH